MDYPLKPENAVAAIRISSVKQGLQGDSPEAQKDPTGNRTQYAVTTITIRKRNGSSKLIISKWNLPDLIIFF
jgi:hypothetical protein